MNILYKKQLIAAVAVIALSSAAFAQKTKVKTITIINGDTTIKESNVDEKDLATIEKNMDISINNDGKSGKSVVKKIIIKSDGDDAEASAYAYSMGDDKDPNIEITTDEDGKATKIIIKKDDDKTEAKDQKNKKVVVKKYSNSTVVTSDNSQKESLDVNIDLKNTTANIAVQSGSTAPLNVSILDENGKQVFYDSQKDGSNYKKEIELKNKGTYFVNLIQDKKSTTEKIVVE